MQDTEIQVCWDEIPCCWTCGSDVEWNVFTFKQSGMFECGSTIP